ncbi:hypothetical protein [Bradyrhizobium vignae]|uniref:hypothetical protein n=1 Tax=Bradyrhizobium vignae TaxID=1549949 RepID=UPI0035E0ACB7
MFALTVTSTLSPCSMFLGSCDHDDSDSERRQSLDCDRPHRYAPRHAKLGASGPGDPQAWFTDILARIAAHPAHRLDSSCFGIGRLHQRSPLKRHDHARPEQGSSRHHHPVAKDLGEDEDWLRDIAIEMEIQDGLNWVYGVGGDGVQAFTDFGIRKCDRARQVLQRRHLPAHALATGMIQPACGLRRMPPTEIAVDGKGRGSCKRPIFNN